MENLAKKEDCDIQIEKELKRSRIEIVRDGKRDGEVPASLSGKLGSFTFRRAWYYWVVDGNVPLVVAQELYKDSVGRTDVRVAGHCLCPPPEDPWITWLDKDGKAGIPTKEKEEFDRLCGKNLLDSSVLNKYRFSDDPAKDGFSSFITSYHIDTEIGLRLFADTLRKYNLV